MKTLTLILIALATGQCSAYLIKVPTKPTQPTIASVGWEHIQKLMLPLFENVCEESTNEIVIRLAQEFNLDPTTSTYTKPDVISNYINLKLLPKGEIFTEYDVNHMKELRALYEVFYYAKDFDTFYKAACWARQNVNCGLFVDAIYLAVLNRGDTSKISVPAPYELIPNYFIAKDVIFQASSLLSGEDLTVVEDVMVENNAYILYANYTIEVNNDSEDTELAYFREDIGLNSYYFLRKLRNAPWFNTPNDINNNYGEYMFLMMKQFAARYDLERYSNGLAELESLKLDSVITAYNPMLIYSNGDEFSYRTFSGILSDSDDITFLKTIENNLATIVDHLRQAGHNKTQILNHLIEILVTSAKSYENIARRLLSSDVEVNGRQCSTLEHYLTSMRDPIFWRINKKIVELIDNSLNVIPSYSKKDLYFPGVEVLNVETKKMMTSFENFQFDVTDSLKTTNKSTTFQVKISQLRLDHKPFTMKLNISSLVTQKGLIKLYLGPKTMPGEFSLKKHLFVMMDKFEFNLKRGINIISRSSEEMKSFSNDFIPLRAIRKSVQDFEFGLDDALPLNDVESQVGYPSRLVLPKGLPEGLPFQIFVFVAPFTQTSLDSSYLTSNVGYNAAVMSPGYPLDLNIEDTLISSLPNVLLKEIIITHKGDGKTSGYSKGGPKKWDPNNSYGSARFDYTTKQEKKYNEFRDYTDEENLGNMIDEAHDLLGKKPSFETTENTNNAASMNQYLDKEKYSPNEENYKTQNFQTTNKYIALNLVDPKYLDKEQIETVSTTTVSMDSITTFDESDSNNEIGKNYQSSENTMDKMHGLLGSQSKFYDNKEKEKYASKRSKYINKYSKDDRSMQNELIIESTTHKNSKNVDILDATTETDSTVKNIDHTKYILISDKNNTVIKNITDSNNIYTDKSNVEKFDIITKEIIGNPVTTKTNVMVKEIIQYPIVQEDDRMTTVDDYVDNTDYYRIIEPVYNEEIPKKRVTVYDFLFNNILDEEKVYE